MKLINKAINRGRNLANRDIARHNYSKKELDRKHENADKNMWLGNDYNYSLNLGKAMAYGSKLHKKKFLNKVE